MESRAHDLRTILDAMPLMFFLKDTENRILLTNKAVADTLGLRPEELEGTDTSEWYPDEAAKYHADDLEVMRSRRPKLGIIEPLQISGAEKRWISTDKFPYFDAQGEVAGVLVFIRDATQQALAEAAVRRSEGELQRANEERIRVMDSISDGLWSVELDRDGRILSQYRSPVMERIAGRSGSFPERPEEWLAAVHPEDRERVRAAALELLAGGAGSRVEEYRILMPDESMHWLRDSATVRRTPEEGLRIDRVVTDITARRLAEEERRAFEERAQHAQRLESLGLLAGGVAHDFNNILTGILGYCDLAKDAVDRGSAAREYLEEIREAARRAAGLCNQMLAYSGRGRFALRALDLSETARSVTQWLRSSLARNATIELRLASGLPAFEGEPAQVQQVVMNLLMNAAEALEGKDGTITVRTGAVDCDREDLAGTFVDDGLPPGQYVYIEVSDPGVGMPPEVLPRIFDPFYTTKFAGRGLGLAVVLGIVRGHRGAVEIHSEVGMGTVFRVLFPASALEVADEPAPPASTANAAGHGLVLVVDDEALVRRYARDCLERSGFEVLTAEDGPSALELFRPRTGTVAAVLLDLTMPKADGRDVLAELQRLRPDVRVVLSSGYDEQEVMEGLTSGTVSFIRKPYESETLLRALAGVIDASRS